MSPYEMWKKYRLIFKIEGELGLELVKLEPKEVIESVKDNPVEYKKSYCTADFIQNKFSMGDEVEY